MKMILTSILVLLLSGPIRGQKIYVFMESECPISQYYTQELIHIHTKYPQYIMELVFQKTHSKKTILEFYRHYRIPTTIIFKIDKGNRYTHKFKATITPEVFVLDKQDHLTYSGAIDDHFIGLGKPKTITQAYYLIDVLNSHLQKVPVSYSFHPAIGCLIQ